MRRSLLWLLLSLALLVAGCAPSSETAVVTERPEPIPSTEEQAAPEITQRQVEPARYDTVEARRFDQGKMWTFENPPLDYFEETYGFRPDETWLEKARLGALRFADYCSASLVSSSGLVMTNHHCARESVMKVSQSEEQLLENGFYADSTGAERPVRDLHVDQLVEIEDVTSQVNAAAREIPGRDTEAAAEARERRANELEEELTSQVQARDSLLQVEVVELYSGGKYSAYTFRRYEDVRLVMAPELQLGFFGGESDNFTYPRYVLDVGFFRIYDADGEPLQTNDHFSWNTSGVEAGDAVFVVGNPGSTSRLNTVSQLIYERDYTLPQELEVLRERASIMEEYIASRPEETGQSDLRNAYFSLENSIKAKTGELRGLRDPYLIARRRAAEEELRTAISESDTLQQRYGNTFERLAQLQRSKESVNRQAQAFTYFPHPELGSRVLTRGVYAYFYDQLRRRPGASEEQLRNIREEALSIEDWPRDLEQQFIAARLQEMEEALGASDPTVQRILQGRRPEAVAERLVDRSALVDSARFAAILDEGFLSSRDAAVEVMNPLASLFLEINRQVQDYAATERNLNARLARVRFALSGTEVPPDASFSPRLSDGQVSGYEYNGTEAPPRTTFYGLYNHYYTHQDTAWSLPERWQTPPEEFERDTPLNLVSTNDIAGGNSGSPLLNRDLEIVGVVFDSNVEALPNTYLYTNERARAISVDARGILEALDDMYDADRLVLELERGELVESEAAADARE